MAINKSKGVTRTEELLADLCDRTFLKLWSYPNPIKDDGKELCDLIAIFNNNIFIFFDRESFILNKVNIDPFVNWERWKKKVIDAQIKTAKGAERYIKNRGKIYLDKDLQTPLPINIILDETEIHKIIVAHGAEKACKNSSDENINGSLAISYTNSKLVQPTPFLIYIDKDDPIHIFDSYNLHIILNELDTFYDFTTFLKAKIKAIKIYDTLSYCGEEDLLAHYFLNYDKSKQEHFIGVKKGNFNDITICEGEWQNFIKLKQYKMKKKSDEVSYFWDELIQKTCHHTLEGTLIGDSTPLRGKSAIHEMAKEPRFFRRIISEHFIDAIRKFPESSGQFVRYLSYTPSFYENKGYVFLQIKALGYHCDKTEYRRRRQAMLEIACGAAKNKFNNLKTVIGIAIDAPKYAEENSEDFILLDCTNWSNEIKIEYENANKDLQFFQTENMSTSKQFTTEFPNDDNIKTSTIGRNDLCPCGSGKKY
ncbi:MAG: SEC-C domain-containing protein, partial [Candidatus Margulisbacteria bacterium]|nr:SEC-C domain-containing protein [Candidatus Margulisiibacteriota bacterium]